MEWVAEWPWNSQLIYDTPIGASGLLWRDLQSWFEHEAGLEAGKGMCR